MSQISPASPAFSRAARKTWFHTGSFIAVVFLFWMALQLYVPTLPVFIQIRTGDLAVTGVILSMSGLMGLIIRLPLGMVTDWLGVCKPFIIAGLLLGGLGAYILATAQEPNGLAIGRALTGLAAGAWVPMLVLFSGLFPADKAVRATAILTVVLSFSRMLATSLTGWLNELGGYPLAFFLSAGLAGLAILFLIPTHEARQPSHLPSWQAFKKLIARRDVLVPSLLNIIGQYVGVAAVFSFGPILAQRLGADNVTLSMLVTWNLVIYTLGNLSATILTRYLPNKGIVMGSFVLMAAGLGIIALAPSVVWIFVANACYGFAGGNSYPLLMGLSIEKVSIGERSTAMGIHQSIYGIGTFAGPWLSGILAKSLGIQPMFGVTAFACLALGWAGSSWLVKEKADDLAA